MWEGTGQKEDVMTFQESSGSYFGYRRKPLKFVKFPILEVYALCGAFYVSVLGGGSTGYCE